MQRPSKLYMLNELFLLVLSLFIFQTHLIAQSVTIGFENASTSTDYFDSKSPLSWFVRTATGGALTRPVAGQHDKADDFTFDLADQFAVSPDGTTYSFRLKKGLSFHNEKEVATSDVIYSLKKCLAEKLIEGVDSVSSREERAGVGVTRTWIDIKAESGTSVNVPLELAQCTVVDSDLAGLFGQEWGTGNNLISTGPYLIDDFRSGQYITLRRFERFSGRKAFNQTVNLRYFKDSVQGLAALRLGTIDAFFTNNVLILETASKDETLVSKECSIFGRLISRRGLALECRPTVSFDRLKYSS